MFPTWAIVLLALAFAALVIFAGGGLIAARRHRRAAPKPFGERVGEVDRALATARAEDRGWDRALLEDVARRELAARRPESEVQGLELVQVIDRPGTDEDQAMFRVVCADGPATLTLGRRAGAWFSEALVDERG